MLLMIVKVEGNLDSPRYGHGAVLINKKLYIYGGCNVASTTEPYATDNENLDIINELITLDVSTSFKTDNPTWEANSNVDNPKLFNHGITSDGNDLMILFGGITDNADGSILWYCHTNGTLKLQPSNVNNEKISSRVLFGGMASDNNNSYIIGGVDPLTLSSVLPPQRIISIGISSIESDIAISSYISANVTSYDHTATLLNGKIYVIGGVHYYDLESGSYVDMSLIGVYDTFNGTWSTLPATGDIPERHENAIIIYGGFGFADTDANVTVDTVGLFKLDVSSSPLTWEKLSITGPDPGVRHGHTFTLVGDYIIGTYVASTIDPFGFNDNLNLNITNEFIILDVSGSFKTDNPLWVVNNNSANPNLFNHGVTSGGDDLMIIFGGTSDAISNPNNSILWYCHTDESSKMFQSSTTISSRILLGLTSDNNNTYIIGGTTLTQGAIQDRGIVTININSIESGIAISNYIIANVTSYDHTATLLDGKIYVIGGIHYYDVGSYVNMSSIGVYNTKDGTWTTGTIPDRRRAHRAVADTNNLFRLNVLSLTWEKLNIMGPDPGSRYGHTFTLVGNYIIGTYGLSRSNTSLSNIFILDLNTLSWTNVFSSNTPPEGSSTKYLVIAWSLLGGFLISALVFLYWWIGKRWRRNRRDNRGTTEEKDEDKDNA
ncbi:2248_t:CDS:10 [Diversispora eburnea]|uniref:2248_t:CDS:1 n=1 Tax=Diversispora eburnea TaxID=1213867 RepID=A0A9N8ZY31_9GLOM|nr:2248_t:CDS:10 [Diversispora eburnea]